MACASFKNMEVFEKKRIVLKTGKKGNTEENEFKRSPTIGKLQ
jgi:hypothetical protein